MVMNDWRVQSWVTSEECSLSIRSVTCPAQRAEARNAATVAISFGLPVTLLVALDLLVISGNSLVIVSVLTDRKLRSVTNTFIISLAVSDLLLGLAVLPFSSANEVLGYWPFGTLWCSVWLAIDVWLCTASILNLCAISLDRFLAISRPIRYPSLMTRYRARLFVVVVWVLSFCIAIPPLLGWNGRSEDNAPNGTSTKNSTTANWTLDLATALSCNSTGRYPGLARSTTFKEDLQSASGSHTDCTYAPPTCALTSETSYIIYSASGSFWLPMLFMVFFYIRIYRTANLATSALRRGVVATKRPCPTPGPSTAPPDLNLRVHRGGTNQGFAESTLQSSSSPVVGSRRMTQLRSQLALDPSHFRSSIYVLPSAESLCSVAGSEPSSPDVTSSGGGARNTKTVFQVRNQLRRLNREKKAAKTVGIVVGCFILCWTPFFTVYLLGAFCAECTPHSVFAVFFWLGYCNSAVNPLLYGLCSKDFRKAFRQLVCCHRRPRPRVKRLQRSLVLYARSR